MNSDEKFVTLAPSEVATALEWAFAANVVPLVLGPPGVGKSDISRQVTERLKYHLVRERCYTLDLTDWRGVPDIKRHADGSRRTVWSPPNFLPTEADPPTVVFFDDVTLTPPQCQPPLYDVLLDRRVGTVYQAPESTRFVCAGNTTADGSFANRLGAALRDRLVILHMRQDIEDWSAWAYKSDISPAVIAFCRFRPELLHAFDPKAMVSPTARGWEFVSKIVRASKHNGRVREALIAGKIGYPAMVEFTAFERLFHEVPDLVEIIKNPDRAPVPNRAELRYAVASALAFHATAKNWAAVVTYLERLPEEYNVFSIKLAVERDQKLIVADGVFAAWVVRHAGFVS